MKGPIRPEELSEKAESCRENLWNEIQLKGPLRQKQTHEENKKNEREMMMMMDDATNSCVLDVKTNLVLVSSCTQLEHKQ